MTQYLLRRITYSLLALIVIASLMFVLLRLTGDPATATLGAEASPAAVESFRREWGLDRPIWEQYAVFVSHVVRGDFGVSFRSLEPALKLVLERLPTTVQLALAAMAVTLIIAVPLGIVAALKKDRPVDAAAMSFAVVGQSIPGFFLGILLILVFAVQLRWLPVAGGQGFASLVLPAVALGVSGAGLVSRLLRSSLAEAMLGDYVRTARSKGLSERVVLTRHALKNALLPVITVLGLQMGHLFGGAVIAEVVFSYPGIGLLLNQAIFNADFAVVQAAVTMIGAIVIVLNLLTDLLYAFLNPRIRYA
jgi:peptide/nickel transport system permease protein